MGIRSIIIITIACFGLSAADYCSTDALGDTNATPIRLQDRRVYYPNYTIQIPSAETCQMYNSRAVGVLVTACSPYSQPLVNVLSLSLAEVRNAQSESVVSIIVYCNINGSTVSVSLPEPKVTALAQQRAQGRRYKGLGVSLFNAGLI